MTPHHATLHASRAFPTLRVAGLALGLTLAANAWANDPPAADAEAKKPTAAVSAPAKVAPKAMGRKAADKAKPEDALFTDTGSAMVDKIRAALTGTAAADKKAAPPNRSAATPRAKQPVAAVTDATNHGGEAHWAYEGEAGPQSWGNLKPDFSTCAVGKRQSPINIESGSTLQGPAEPVQFAYAPSNGTVVNNGHTIQVDVQGENSITVRGSTYRLLQFHFHTPSEEQINSRRFPMVAHLVHKNNEGQLAVVAVLLDEGAANPLMDKVWTYMPLDANDRVRMPQDLLNVSELLPTDQRYYQFMGSLTTPPCSEGVLWMVLKQPVTISKGQYKLFTQLYPNNARPVQAVNGRPVREAL